MVFNARLYLFLFTILFLTGCASLTEKFGQNSSDKSDDEEPVVVEPTMVKLTYLDSDIFDQGLASNMGAANREIHLKFPIKFSLNAMPERIDSWLNQIVKRGGSVKVEEAPDPEIKSRSLTLLVPIIKMAVSMYNRPEEEKNIYDPSANYNGKVLYDVKTGEVQQIIFSPRKLTKKVGDKSFFSSITMDDLESWYKTVKEYKEAQ